MRVVLTLLLLIATAPARADWVKVGKSEKTVLYVMSEETVYYIDPATITKEGNLGRVWEIHDMTEKGPRGERSILAQVEYDCAEKQMRTLHASGHSQRMAKGEIIALGKPAEDWTILQPGKSTENFYKILNIVCAP
jgi:hypothetical protein